LNLIVPYEYCNFSNIFIDQIKIIRPALCF
jgi:hypothetical protein